MQENEQQNQDLYASYNMLARKPLMFGVPLLTLIAIAFGVVVSTGAGMLFLESIPLILITPITLICILFGLRILCENDSRAMDNLAWVVKGFALRLKVKSTVCSISPQLDAPELKKEKIHDFFKHN
ncbi:hypothetical protein TUM4438_31250 [Shewanella sairae]|uniref:Conjugal transfer protein TraD n=1 Tax=Shewanella sairae TaxID=190310 RepID=A0ABQ4PLI2_9GAMM|nr:hypothetical protein [Shewanella sairae]MCL1131895.1 hypothetical protein [Shewanella sairae]GIU48876.1 hypothetical protein TUM4438_31250 [Shewanella sairae]